MLDSFFDVSLVETERRNRIRLSVAAYAYEYLSETIMSDGDFDALCLKIDKTVKTGNEEMDKFFEEEFDPSTGMWIRNHPKLQDIGDIYYWNYKRKVKKK